MNAVLCLTLLTAASSGRRPGFLFLYTFHKKPRAAKCTARAVGGHRRHRALVVRISDIQPVSSGKVNIMTRGNTLFSCL